MEAFRRLNYLFSCHDSSVVYTDNRNVLFDFHPVDIKPNLGRHKVLEVVRCALFLFDFTYKILHVPGDENVIADILR